MVAYRFRFSSLIITVQYCFLLELQLVIRPHRTLSLLRILYGTVAFVSLELVCLKREE
jgi:hypothetical protein